MAVTERNLKAREMRTGKVIEIKGHLKDTVDFSLTVFSLKNSPIVPSRHCQKCRIWFQNVLQAQKVVKRYIDRHAKIA